MSKHPLEEIELILKIISHSLSSTNLIRPEDIDNILKILSNKKRRQMLFELAQGDEYVNELVEKLDYHPQSIIRHLTVLKDNNLISGKQRVISGPGRPRLYYTLDPDLAKVLHNTKKTNKSETCNVFPRLQFFLNRLNEPITHSELDEIIRLIEGIKTEHTQAINVCDEILKKIKTRIFEIEITD